MIIKPFKYTVILIAALIFPTLSVLSYNLYIDPFQIIHKDFKKPYIIFGGRGTDRYQHAGIINNYPVKSIILGNSHSANFLPSKLEKELKLKNSYNLTMAGATIAEQTFPGRFALGKRNVKYVLWGVSSGHLMQKADARNSEMVLPKYLYDNNRFNDLQFFLTFDLQKYQRLKKIRKLAIINCSDPEKMQQQEFDKATSWYKKNGSNFDRPLFVAHKILREEKLNYSKVQNAKLKPLPDKGFIKIIGNDEKYFKKIIEKSNINIQENITPLIEDNPDVQFDFVFTAYPTLKSQVWKVYKEKRYLASLLVIKNFTIVMSKYQNVRVFGFGLEKFTDDLRLYKDPGHYHIEVNNYIIRVIAANENILHKDNINDYLISFDKKVSQYRLPKIWNPIYKKKISSKGESLSIMKARNLM